MNYLNKFFFNFYSYAVMTQCYFLFDLMHIRRYSSMKWQLYGCALYFLLFASYLLWTVKSKRENKAMIKLEDYIIPLYYFFAMGMIYGFNYNFYYTEGTWRILYCVAAVSHFVHYLYLLYKSK